MQFDGNITRDLILLLANDREFRDGFIDQWHSPYAAYFSEPDIDLRGYVRFSFPDEYAWALTTLADHIGIDTGNCLIELAEQQMNFGGIEYEGDPDSDRGRAESLFWRAEQFITRVQNLLSLRGGPEVSVETDKKTDSRKKTLPRNIRIRMLCRELKKGVAKGREQLEIAREFAADDEVPENLLKQASRFPHLWRDDGQ